MSDDPNSQRGRAKLFWVLLALGIAAVILILYVSLGGPDDLPKYENGIDARENVDEVIFLEDANPLSQEIEEEATPSEQDKVE